MIGFALCHGWAFDARAMDAFARSLQDRFPQAAMAVFDLGFTGQPHTPSLSGMEAGDRQWIAIGHSYGFAYLMQQSMNWWAMVSVNGFTRFCRQPGKPEGTPRRLLDAMIARLETDPLATVADFRERCGSTQASPQQLDVPLLRTHLMQLRDLDLHAPACPVLALTTRDDPIVAPPLAHACFAPPACRITEFDGSHMALLQAPQACMPAVKAFVEALHD